MNNFIVKLILTVFFSTLLINTHLLAFHKNGTLDKIIEVQEGIKKKDIQSNHCAVQVEKIIPPKKEDNKEQTEKTKEDGILIINEKTKYSVIDYHGEFLEAPKELDFSILKNKIGGILYLGPNYTIEQLLDYYCIQEQPEENKDTLFKKANKTLLDTIAEINEYSGKDSKIEGKIFDDGKIKLFIEGKQLIYAKAQFIIDEENRIQVLKAKEAEDKRIADQKRKERNARKNAEKKGNEQWISENKANFLDLFEKKLNEYENKISDLETKRKNLKTNLDIFEQFMSDAEEDSKNAIADLVNRDNQQIKDLREILRDNIKEYLSKNDFEGYKLKFKNIEKVNFKKYRNYTTLKDLIKRAEKSKKAKDFVGKDGFEIKLPDFLGGKTKKITGDKIGFIQEFKNIEKRELGSGSVEDEENMDQLNKSIEDHSENIKNYVNFKVDELKALDEELGQRIPWNLIIIGAVIAIIIIAAGVYLYFQRKEMDQLKREAEEKVGSLKNEFEGKLKSTSEQIKSVSRNTQSSQQNSLKAEEIVEEKPKTPEEIIAEKYDELVSDYKEALDDFTKVAGFKQKWHGLALSRKERQEGTKTILINSSRAFEKAEIWCVTFSDKYFAFPGSTVKSNMATYMNLDFEKASRDFKGVFAVSTGSSYTTEPCVLRRGGAGFVVERVGKIIFPN